MTTDVGLRVMNPKDRLEYARFESAHEAGDEVSVFGEVVERTGGMYVDATHWVVGDFSELRRRAAVQVVAFLVLTALAFLGPLALFV